MKHIETLSLKKTRGGFRVYLNNKTLEKKGFTAGIGFREIHDKDKVRVVVDESAKRKVLDSEKGPLMDLRNKSLGDTLPDCDRVTVEYKMGEVIIRAYYHAKRVLNREKALLSKVKNNIPLRMGDLFAGIGLLSKQVHAGLMIAGITSSMAFANELERLPADVHVNSNPVWKTAAKDAVFVQDNLLTMDKSLVPELDCMLIGYSCRPFSIAQGANRDRDLAHPDGTLFIPTMDVINRANPAIVILENSENMLNSTTLKLMDSIMTATGYYRTHTVLSGHDHGDFERRHRLCVVWVSAGLKGLDVSHLVGTEPEKRYVSDILEPIDENDKAWKDLSYIAKKEAETSHNHKMCVVQGSDTKMPTITANYAKIQADTPFVSHPSINGLHRILTPTEHANVRRMSGQYKQAIVDIANGNHHLTTRTNATAAHRMLGNAIAPKPWEALGIFIGGWLKSLCVPSTPITLEKIETCHIEQSGQLAMEI